MEKLGSDHRPVMVHLMGSQNTSIGKAWQRNNGHGIVSIMGRLGRCRKALSMWKKNSNLNSMERLQRLHNELEVESSLRYPCFEYMRELKIEIAKKFREEEVFCTKRAKTKG